MDNIRVAAIMFNSQFPDIEGNLENTEKWIKEAQKVKAEIVCFPELNITGYSLSNKISKYADTIPGRITLEIERMAASYNMTIIVGMVETDKASNMITQVVIGPDGFIGKYQKVHLSDGEKKFFTPGKEIPVFKLGNTRFGVGLCYDAHFPEFCTICSLKGADIIFFPHASPPPESAEEKRNRWLRYLPARAYDNSVYVVACNQVGKRKEIEFKGIALFIDPKGKVISEAYGEDEGIVCADLKEETLLKVRNSRMGYFIRDRVPDMYTYITKSYLGK
jgi:N-carbamoylputrescine amidase